MSQGVLIHGKVVRGNPDLKTWVRFARQQSDEFALLFQDPVDGTWRILSTSKSEACLISMKESVAEEPENNRFFFKTCHWSEMNSIDD
ncbi:hypothetical protein A3I27_02730 [Candidatus Giovannonibacteria bacterium RIFCSPLOWO2_02_FULL_43_11b]|uniref:Uncharacterized protein n=1 Tax=Candidatus Giovannonibacteria bacterium RIFCSPHIGHO2_12_FULL_43_15 TaxID=1798341 RepID=A0A1F5WRT9_9BACT|nr:MAG: hypothetical protein A3B97_00580 [Candidatus Giovannonibacteria bacterium RIFCSPHIGHO2_02_FULL_43_32]OGF78368.1 MAG: hypothetical protein A3F23_02015 [Candidatus Giovannonibacteria bacterium RIFCSPHIGHO2_12_FULL_43_15]OGF90554.1 MAG: hypothetical protein A3I27_02730 [Candidatus Giovannonibacteria bacterium RIFCSPLOWO2_02_FULL_43_11b]OGF92436.1 MAG: hypothetical protein A3H04_00570 [Candidatus Giovannonibacteria bacterium RIFCSPLOWO2_12_FULL_43_11c]